MTKFVLIFGHPATGSACRYNRNIKRWEIWHESIDPVSNSHFLFSDTLAYIHDW